METVVLCVLGFLFVGYLGYVFLDTREPYGRADLRWYIVMPQESEMDVDITKKFFIGYINDQGGKQRKASPPFKTEGEVLVWASQMMASNPQLNKLYVGEIYGELTRTKPAVELSHLRGHHLVEYEPELSLDTKTVE